MHLDRTIILPTEDSKLAKDLFRDIIAEEAVLAMVILGDDAKSRKAVEMADKLAAIEIQGYRRKVIWIRDPAGLRSELKGLKMGKVSLPSGDDLDAVVAFSLSLDDSVMDIILRKDTVGFVRLDRAFLSAGEAVA